MLVTLALGTPAGGRYFPMKLLLESGPAVEVGQNPDLCLTVSESVLFQALPDSRLWHYQSVLLLPGAAPHFLEVAVVVVLSPVDPCVPHLEAAVACPLRVGSRPDAAFPTACP